MFLNLLNYDLHNLSNDVFCTNVSKADYVLNGCMSKQFKMKDYTYALAGEDWLGASSPVIENPDLIDDKFILITHAISRGELDYALFKARPYDVSVFGASYAFRRTARSYLSGLDDINASCNHGKVQSMLGRLSNQYILSPKFGFTYTYRPRFKKMLATSKVSVTCDRSIGYPIRKFFEIPASGALLAGSFFDGAQELGFVDKQNCFFVGRDHVEGLHDIVLARAWRR